MADTRACPICGDPIMPGHRWPHAYKRLKTCGEPHCVARARLASNTRSRVAPETTAAAAEPRWCQQCGVRLVPRYGEGTLRFSQRRHCSRECSDRGKANRYFAPQGVRPGPPVIGQWDDAEAKWAALLPADAYASEVRTAACGAVGMAPSMFEISRCGAGEDDDRRQRR